MTESVVLLPRRLNVDTLLAEEGSMSFSRRGERTLPPEMEEAAAAKQREFEEMLAKESATSSAAGGPGPPKGPRTVVCYICGREFGRSSIEIHEKQCAQ
eukprot:6471022-Amphidinium_carterae.1